MDTACVPLPSGYSTLRSTLFFLLLHCHLSLSFPHKFLTSLLHRLDWLPIWLRDRAIVSRTDGLAAAVWPLCGHRVGPIQSARALRLTHRDIPHLFPHELLAAPLRGIGRLAFRQSIVFYVGFIAWEIRLILDVNIPRFTLKRFGFRQIRKVVLNRCGLVDSILCLDWKRLPIVRWTRLFRLIIWASFVIVCVGFLPPGPISSLFMCQLFQPIYSLPGNGSGRILSAVSLSFLPPPTLSGVPVLALQFFRASEQAAPKQFLRRGLDFFFGAVCNSLLFFDFLDRRSPPNLVEDYCRSWYNVFIKN